MDFAPNKFLVATLGRWQYLKDSDTGCISEARRQRRVGIRFKSCLAKNLGYPYGDPINRDRTLIELAVSVKLPMRPVHLGNRDSAIGYFGVESVR